jgi:iron complex transport system substrate-binding protein
MRAGLVNVWMGLEVRPRNSNDEIPMTKTTKLPVVSCQLPVKKPFAFTGNWQLTTGNSFSFRHSFVIRISLFVILTLGSCNKPQSSATTNPTSPTIASMVPAATDLIIGMGEKDRLLAVSNTDDVDHLPKVGGYGAPDWELLRSLHPTILITEMSPARQDAGFKANAAELNITPINLKIEKLEDIFNALDVLGNAMKVPAAAATAKAKMQTRLDAVRQRVAGQKPVATLIVIGSNADMIAGPGTFLDDLLTIAGGRNASSSPGWPQIDREMLLSLKPDVIMQLLPDAPQQERDQAAAIWKQYPQIPAVAAGRVYPIYDGYAELPGWHVTDLAEKFSQCLHPSR